VLKILFFVYPDHYLYDKILHIQLTEVGIKVRVVNAIEQVVFQIFKDEFLKNTTLSCPCERCQLDIVALALNRLPPRYVVTEQGNIYVKALYAERQLISDVIRELSNAALIVQERPNHVG
jgi:competence protein ComFB